jgi:arginase
MRKCLSPFFIGREEPGLDIGLGSFDIQLLQSLIACEPVSKNAISNINCAIRDFITETVSIGEKPMVLSGDCLSAIGCLAGLQKCEIQPYLLWFDAHGDFHTPETTISGHIGGMPLAMITGRGDLSLLTGVNLAPLPDKRVYFIGGRDIEPGEKEAMELSNIHMCNRITDILSELPKKPNFWVHFDTDYINPIDAPAMRYPAKGGISAQLVKSDLNALASRTNIVGLSVSAWAPHLDFERQTAITCWDVISALVT